MDIIKKSLLLLFTILLIGFSTEGFCVEKKVRLASSEYPPYFGSELKNKGFLTEVTVEAFKRVGYQTEVEFYPFARTFEYGKSGEVDGIIVLWYTKEREQWFAFSNPLPPNLLGFYKHKSEKINFRTYSDLKPYEIGIVRGYANPSGFDEANLHTQAVVKDTQNLFKLYRKRIDLVLIDKGVAQYIINTQYPEYEKKLEWLEPALQVKPQYIAFSKKANNYERKLKDFNLGLIRLTEEGGVREIMNKHGVKVE